MSWLGQIASGSSGIGGVAPPRVEYSLTDKGKDLLIVLRHFADWVNRWNDEEGKQTVGMEK